MKTWQLVIFALAALVPLLTIYTYARDYAKLGAVKFRGRKGFKYADKIQLFIVLILMLLFAFTLIPTEGNALPKLYYIMYGGVVAMLALSYVVCSLYPKGIYEKGIATNSVVILYENLQSIYPEKDEKIGCVKYILNERKGLFSSNCFVVIEAEAESEAKAFLKAKGCFKKKNARR